MEDAVAQLNRLSDLARICALKRLRVSFSLTGNFQRHEGRYTVTVSPDLQNTQRKICCFYGDDLLHTLSEAMSSALQRV